MTEDQLQQQIVTYFHNTYPEHRGMLFEVNNKTDKGAHRRALGLVPGASDLLYIDTKGIAHAMELKAPGTRHDVKHLEKQLNWGQRVALRGGSTSFIFSLEQFKQEFENIKHNHLHKSWCYVDRMVNEAKTKTVKLEWPT